MLKPRFPYLQNQVRSSSLGKLSHGLFLWTHRPHGEGRRDPSRGCLSSCTHPHPWTLGAKHSQKQSESFTALFASSREKTEHEIHSATLKKGDKEISKWSFPLVDQGWGSWDIHIFPSREQTSGEEKDHGLSQLLPKHKVVPSKTPKDNSVFFKQHDGLNLAILSMPTGCELKPN